MHIPAGLQPARAPIPAAGGDSPAANYKATWTEFKNFVQTSAPAAQRFKSHIIGAQQQEVDALRAQVARLSGILQPNDPEYVEIVREARARFAKPAGPKMFAKRRAKLKTMEGNLNAMEENVGELLSSISALRLNCMLYAGQVEKDDAQAGEIGEEKNLRASRWEEQDAERKRLKDERIKRNQEKRNKERAREQQQLGIAAEHFNRFLPANMRPPPAPAANAPFPTPTTAYAPFPAAYAPAPAAYAPGAADARMADDSDTDSA